MALSWLEWLLEDDIISLQSYIIAIQYHMDAEELLIVCGISENMIEKLAKRYLKEIKEISISI